MDEKISGEGGWTSQFILTKPELMTAGTEERHLSELIGQALNSDDSDDIHCIVVYGCQIEW